jgi:hypothetical protein
MYITSTTDYLRELFAKMVEIKWHVNELDSAIMLNGTFVLPQRLVDGANRGDVILGELLFRGSRGCSIRVGVYRQVLYQSLTLILSWRQTFQVLAMSKQFVIPKTQNTLETNFWPVQSFLVIVMQ